MENCHHIKYLKRINVKCVLHNESGPAYLNLDTGEQQWWIEGKQLTKKEFESYLKMKCFW